MTKQKIVKHKKISNRLAFENRREDTFWKVRKLDLKIMSRDAACMLALFSYFQDQVNKRSRKKGKRPSRWIYCTIPYMERELVMKRSVQDRVIHELHQKGFLKIKITGTPPTRHFKVKWLNIEKAIQEKLEEEEEANSANNGGGFGDVFDGINPKKWVKQKEAQEG